MKKAAVLFPGIGYTNDRPLLYYAGKLARKEGYDLLKVQYSQDPKSVKGSPEKMQDTLKECLHQASVQLEENNLAQYDRLLFISKSIGSFIAIQAATMTSACVDQILYTPFPQALDLFKDNQELIGRCIAFNGTNDSWIDVNEIETAAKKADIDLHLIQDGNHSLETGNLETDLDNLKKIMMATKTLIEDLK